MCAGPNQSLAAKGRLGDTELAHVNPKEKVMLKAMGGSGTTNPKTGLKEYHWYHSHSSPISIPTPKIPTSTGDIGIISDIADATGYTGSDLDEAGQQLEGDVKGFVDDVTGAVVDAGEAVSGTYESGEFNPSFYMDDPMGFGGGFFSDFDYTLDDFSDDISGSTPDLVIDTTGLTDLTQGIATGITDTSAVVGETVGGITGDLLQGDLGTVMTDGTGTVGDFITNPLGTTQEILDHNLGDTGLKGALDQTVDFVKNPSKVIKDAVDRAEDFGEGTSEEVTGTVEDYGEVVTDIGETAEEIGEVATETQTTGMETVTQAGENAATQVTQAGDDLINALVAAGLLTRREANEDGVGNAEAIMAGDPRMLSLMARRNRARKMGKSKLRKGGGLYIPVGTGLQVPA